MLREQQKRVPIHDEVRLVRACVECQLETLAGWSPRTKVTATLQMPMVTLSGALPLL